jgi:hypothetical protein
MTAGVRGGGFVMGAVGGLALALLLVGVVSYLPQAAFLPQGNPSQAANMAAKTAPSAPSPSTTAALDMSTTSSHVAASTTTSPEAQNAASGAPAVAAGAASSTTAARSAQTTVATANSGSSSSVLYNSGPPPNALGGGVSNGTQPQQLRPGSQLTALPRESIGSLVATLSPLLVGLLVAALIYSAYSRRQDSSS